MLPKRKVARGPWRRKNDGDVQADYEEVKEQKEAKSSAANDMIDLFFPPGEDSRIVLETVSSDSIGHCAKNKYSTGGVPNDVIAERDLQTPTTCPSNRSIETVLHEQHWFDVIIEPQIIVSRDNSIYNYSTQSYEQDGPPVRIDSFATGIFTDPDAWPQSFPDKEIDRDDFTLASIAKDEGTGVSLEEPVPTVVFDTPPTLLDSEEGFFADEGGKSDNDHDADMKSNKSQVQTAEDVARPPSDVIAASSPVDQTKTISTSPEEKSSKKRHGSRFRVFIGRLFLKRDRKCKDHDGQSDHVLPPEVEIDSDRFQEETSSVPNTENAEAQPTSEDVPVDHNKVCSENEKAEPSTEKSAPAVVEAEQEENPAIGSDGEISEKAISVSTLEASPIVSPDSKVKRPRILFWKRKDRGATSDPTPLKQVDEEEESVFTYATDSTAGWEKEISRQHNIITVATIPQKEQPSEMRKSKRWKKKIGFWRKDKQSLGDVAENSEDHVSPSFCTLTSRSP